jgi:nucleoside permease NupC
MGVTQSIGSMARIIGPLFALSLMDLKLELPYLICALIAIIASILAFLLIIAPSKEVVQPTETETKIDGDKSADNYAEETPKSPKRIQLPAKKDEPSAS